MNPRGGAGRDAPAGSEPGGEAGGPGPVPRLHVVIPDGVARRPAFPALARGLREAAGARLALHLRLKEATGRRIHELAAALARGARRSGGWCVVNERVDVALSARAQAAQLGAGALPVAAARQVLGPGVAVGASVHDADAAARAAGAGANFLVVGTIFETASHPGRPGAGPGLVERCRRRVALPLVAIGGVTPGRVGELLEAGAHGVAALSGVWSAPAPREAVERYLDALERAVDV